MADNPEIDVEEVLNRNGVKTGPVNAPEQPEEPLRVGHVPIDHPAAKAILSALPESYGHLRTRILAYDFEHCYTRMNRDKPYYKDDVVAAILWSASNFGQMAVLLGRNRNRIREYVESHPDMYEIFYDVDDTMMDFIESAGKFQAVMGDGAMIRFYLQTLGKDRGYVTRVENTGKGGSPLNGPDLSQYSEDDLERIAEAHRTAQRNAQS